MTYLALYLTPSFLIALHSARIYARSRIAEYREEKRRRDEVHRLELLWFSNEEPRV